MRGPTPTSLYELKESGGPVLGSDDVESKWQMSFLYANPEHRGKGLAKRLIEGGLAYAAANGGEGVSRARVRIMYSPYNETVKSLYSGLDFQAAGRVTLAEAFVTNGDENLLPEDGGKSAPEMWHNRLGAAMEKVVERQS